MALDGNRLALFLAQTLTDALSEYVERESQPKPEAIIKDLLAEEDLLYHDFKGAPLPELAFALSDKRGQHDDMVVPHDIDVETLFRAPSICHGARTPAQTRYLGILTDTDKVGGIAVHGYETHDIGITHKEAVETDAKGEMRLAYNKERAWDRTNCLVPIKPDYKDYFFAHGKDGWAKLVIPNKSEKRYYNYDPAAVKGILVIFFGSCDWGRCDVDDMQADAYKQGLLEFEVNGRTVTNLTQIGGGLGGHLLKGEQGVNWTPNSDGVFEIRANVKNPRGYVRLSAVILY
jgi:hypothetical protein